MSDVLLTRKQLRSRRPRAVRARTVSIKRLAKAEIAIGRALWPEVEGVERPATRADCVGGERPCPFVSCKHHLYLDVSARTGSIKLNFPDLDVDEMRDTCALDVADLGGRTLEQVGATMNLTRERVRQLERSAFVRFLHEWETTGKTTPADATTPAGGCSLQGTGETTMTKIARKTKKATGTVRQGDVILIPTTEAPSDTLAPSDTRGIVLAEGETSGHHHAVFGRGCKLFARSANERMLVVGRGGAEVRVVGGGAGGVDRHTPIALAPGRFLVRVQRSWTSENASRQVQD